MKNDKSSVLSFLISIFTLTVLIFFSSAQVKADGFNSVCFNGSALFVVGQNGVIYKSGNTGQTFSSISFGSTNFNSVFTRTVNVWIAGDNGLILKSTNLGISFSQSNIAIENLKSVYFIDNLTGWVACNNGKILQTVNGGLNWTIQTTGTSNNLNIIKFFNFSRGVACGDNSTILITTNGGSQWNSAALPVSKNILSVDINDSSIFAGCSDGLVVKSTNLGVSWGIIDYKVSTKPDITGIAMTNPSSYYSCGTGGFIRKSTNGGSTFTYENNPAWIDLSYLYFYDAFNGWAISNTSNIVLRTSNGGVNWSMPTGTVQNLSWQQKLPLQFYTSSGNDFYQSSWNKKEIFVTKANLIYRSLDIGETWTQVGTNIPTGSISNSFYISTKDTNVFLVAIDSINDVNAWVYRSTNYGNTWSISLGGNRSSDGTPIGRDPNHPDTLYYGSRNSSLFRTTNFGLSWTTIGSYHFSDVCYIKVPEGKPNVIIVGGRNWENINAPFANIVRSSDYGQTWNLIDSNGGVDPDLPELPVIVSSPLDSTMYYGFYEGNNGGMRRSTNFGANWSQMSIDEYIWGMDVSKDDPNVLAYTDWGGPSSNFGSISYDRGIHFTSLPDAGLTGSFAVYTYNRKTIILQQPFGYYKLRIFTSVPLGIESISTSVPQGFSMSQNYPNPFNPSTKIKFEVPLQSNVKITIFDAAGREAVVLTDQIVSAGTYSVDWNAGNFSSGIYYCRLTSDKFTETRKMVLMK